MRGDRFSSRLVYLCAFISVFSLIPSALFIVTWVIISRDVHSLGDPIQADSPGLRVLGNGLHFKPYEQTLSIGWRVLACNTPSNASDECQSFGEPFDLYLNDRSKPVFSYNPDETEGGETGVPDRWIFDTKLLISKSDNLYSERRLRNVFARYSFDAYVFAINPVTNDSLNILTFTVNSTFEDFVLRSHGGPSMSKFVFCSSNQWVTPHQLEAKLELSAIAKAHSSFLFLASWGLTICSVYITLLAANEGLKRESPLISVPPGAGAVIFSLHAASSSPPFGATVETVSTFVQLMSLSFCCLVLLVILAQPLPPLHDGRSVSLTETHTPVSPIDNIVV